MKYIDAEKLKRLVGELKEHTKRNCCDVWGIVPDALEEVEGFITSLQQEQPEVDLEKEISTWIPAHIRGGDNEEWKDTKNAVTEWGGVVARHFYELGKNSRKV